MKWLILFFSILQITGLFAGPQEELFLRAAELYKQGNYQEALSTYRSVEPKRPSVWFNMANCAFHCSDFAQAVMYWKKAQRHATASLLHRIDDNLQRCNESLQKNFSASKLASFTYPVYTMLAKIPMGIVQLAFLCLWYLFLITLFVSPTRRRVRVVFSFIGVLCMAGLMVAMHTVHRTQSGVVCKEQVTLYAGPNDRFHQVGELRHLDEVAVYQLQDQWCKVGNSSCMGWVPTDAIEFT